MGSFEAPGQNDNRCSRCLLMSACCLGQAHLDERILQLETVKYQHTHSGSVSTGLFNFENYVAQESGQQSPSYDAYAPALSIIDHDIEELKSRQELVTGIIETLVELCPGDNSSGDDIIMFCKSPSADISSAMLSYTIQQPLPSEKPRAS